jgi:transcriptional regulator with XRE-family HTH domain
VQEARGLTGSPTVRQRELGAPPRALRTERGLTVDQVAAELLCSPAKVSRTETSQYGATLRAASDLCEFYGVTDQAQMARLVGLARGGKEQGWWQTHDLEFSTYADLKYFHSTVIPEFPCA